MAKKFSLEKLCKENRIISNEIITELGFKQIQKYNANLGDGTTGVKINNYTTIPLTDSDYCT